MNLFLMLGGLLALIGVGAGAFGAHALADMLAETGREATFETAVRYQMYHAFGLLALGILKAQAGTVGLLNWSGWLFVVGIVIFSGSLYLLIFTGIRWLGAITPIGGVAFLAGWALLMVYAIRGG